MSSRHPEHLGLSPSQAIRDLDDLENRLSEPSPKAIAALSDLDGDIMVLGVGGKMGPSLARMARRASNVTGKQRRIIGVSRFSSAALPSQLQDWGIETIAADLLDSDQLRDLPDVPNIIYMAGMKFGSSGKSALTWAMNTELPGRISRRFRHSRIAAFSTGNVYGMTSPTSGGSRESDVPAPVGEYAMSCLGRERIFHYWSETLSIPIALIRLNYASEMRYGVLVDLARRVWAQQPIDLATGYFNIIWQGDANAMALAALARVSVPPLVVNVTGPLVVSVRAVCQRFGQIMGVDVEFTGSEADTALLSDSCQSRLLLGAPRIGLEQLIDWTADWVIRGGPFLDKPTHFEARDGTF